MLESGLPSLQVAQHAREWPSQESAASLSVIYFGEGGTWSVWWVSGTSWSFSVVCCLGLMSFCAWWSVSPPSDNLCLKELSSKVVVLSWTNCPTSGMPSVSSFCPSPYLFPFPSVFLPFLTQKSQCNRWQFILSVALWALHLGQSLSSVCMNTLSSSVSEMTFLPVVFPFFSMSKLFR